MFLFVIKYVLILCQIQFRTRRVRAAKKREKSEKTTCKEAEKMRKSVVVLMHTPEAKWA